VTTNHQEATFTLPTAMLRSSKCKPLYKPEASPNTSPSGAIRTGHWRCRRSRRRSSALVHVQLEGLVRLNHGNAAGPCGSEPSLTRLKRREGTKGEEQPLRAVRQRLEAHRGVEAMQTSSVLFPALRRHVQEQQPHTQKWTLCRGRPSGLGGRPDGAGSAACH